MIESQTNLVYGGTDVTWYRNRNKLIGMMLIKCSKTGFRISWSYA